MMYQVCATIILDERSIKAAEKKMEALLQEKVPDFKIESILEVKD